MYVVSSYMVGQLRSNESLDYFKRIIRHFFLSWFPRIHDTHKFLLLNNECLHIKGFSHIINIRNTKKNVFLHMKNALVVQRIARKIPVLKMGVRFPPRALHAYNIRDYGRCLIFVRLLSDEVKNLLFYLPKSEIHQSIIV